MKKILTVLCLCIVSNIAFGAGDDCVKSPYDGKTYCCNVRDNNLPNGAINKSWGEVIPWDKYYGTVRKCIGGRITNDQFGPEIDGVAPNLWGAKIREEASYYKVACYNTFDGTYWNDASCLYGYSDVYDDGGCMFRGFKQGWGSTINNLYVCGENRFPKNVYDYVRTVTGNELVFMNLNDVVRIEDLNWAGFIYRCISYDGGTWEVTPFCTSADVPTDAELQSGVLDHLNDGWLMDDGKGNLTSLKGYDSGWDYWRDKGEYSFLYCWTRGTVENTTSNKTTSSGEIQYNYKSCSSDSDCKGIDNTVRPYLHSTAWHCAWQSAGVRVCTATACENGWTPINGYCQEDKNTQTSQSENKNPNSISNVKTETKAGTKKPCTDLDNMDSNCKCIVAGTVERGGKCVCRDDNQEIKNGKCEWTAKYVAGLESDLDSKFNNLTATIGGFEKNVWRDENGEFNTARLASDSIAGIVLGTVGGIVTANLVKKAQVKQGFEDIGCYIGGQSVAGFGDEFNVGR